MNEELTYVAITTTFWSVFYLVHQKLSKKEPEFSCRLVTFVHACVANCLAMWHCYLATPQDYGSENSSMQKFTVSNSLGYFIFDMVWCLYYQTEGVTMIIHHLVSLTALSSVLVKGVSATEGIAGIGGMEITNPLLQARWYLRTTGRKDTWLYTVVELAFMSLFFLIRVVYGFFLIKRVLLHPKPDLFTKALAASFYMLTVTFMYYIASYFYAKYLRKSSKKVE
ncbi:TLC domain-containing protein 5-like [Neocloeon triangulifer]|uniref:TLC domain-containing protein 5-like n=1 Tax=Neocloeon triangulifer TaxID=2078957 RepID=UPI00286F3ECA|nr:TLC domain-containing protein 5-like [Neocloeon triangulifer]XP_059470067.1 TLC domain-containing protein 5-like [Neocloeon triangulifer]XP_059470068.1 TLC domain-containing protein 5-like [Neocloeon triangulifer]